jgi:hypothetical protein
MISKQLKDAIANCGKSPYQISKETGIAQPILSRFLSDDPETHRDIRLEKTADKLAAYFGLKLSSSKSIAGPTDTPTVKWGAAKKKKPNGRR